MRAVLNFVCKNNFFLLPSLQLDNFADSTLPSQRGKTYNQFHLASSIFACLFSFCYVFTFHNRMRVYSAKRQYPNNKSIITYILVRMALINDHDTAYTVQGRSFYLLRFRPQYRNSVSSLCPLLASLQNNRLVQTGISVRFQRYRSIDKSSDYLINLLFPALIAVATRDNIGQTLIRSFCSAVVGSLSNNTFQQALIGIICFYKSWQRPYWLHSYQAIQFLSRHDKSCPHLRVVDLDTDMTCKDEIRKHFQYTTKPII